MILPRPTRSARGPRRWTAAELEQAAGWRSHWPAEVVEELWSWIEPRVEVLRSGEALTADELMDARRALPRLQALASDLRDQLLKGTGVIWLRGLDGFGLGESFARRCHELLGCAIGAPLDQYGRLFEIRDRGVDHLTKRVPVSMTCATTEFHTDSSRRDVLPDLVGLLCERPALRGGDSLVSNALAVYDRLAAEHPALLAQLRKPWIRDLVTPGTEKTMAALRANAFPVFAGDPRGEDFAMRHMRLWLERGQEEAGEPIDDLTRAALDRLDELLREPRHALRLRLDRGDILWVDNRALAHDRDGYEDDPGAPRCLLRMWIDCGRPQPRTADQEALATV